VFAPIHWSCANSAASGVGALIAPHVDAISGQPESKATPVKIAPFPVAFSGLLIAREELAPTGADYWVRAKGAGAFIHILGFAATPPAGWLAWCGRQLGVAAKRLMWAADEAAGLFGAAYLDRGELHAAALFVPGHRPPDLASVEAWFKAASSAQHNFRMLLSLADFARGEPRKVLRAG